VPGRVKAEAVLWEWVEAAEMDEIWSFVGEQGNKGCQRWLWLAIDRSQNLCTLACVFGHKEG